MEQEQVVLCDTNIVIELYKENQQVISSLKEIGQENMAISTVTSAELIYGALNKKELRKIMRDLKAMNVIDIDPLVCSKFIELIAEYSLSHNLKLPDGLIAATALVHDVHLYTLNLKDFRHIKDIKLWGKL